MAICGDRHIQLAAIQCSQLRQLADKPHHAAPQQRLATGDAYFLNPKRDQQPHHAQILGKAQLGILCAVIPGAAIDALVVAPVGDCDSDVGDVAAVFVAQAHEKELSNLVMSNWAINQDDRVNQVVSIAQLPSFTITQSCFCLERRRVAGTKSLKKDEQPAIGFLSKQGPREALCWLLGVKTREAPAFPPVPSAGLFTSTAIQSRVSSQV